MIRSDSPLPFNPGWIYLVNTSIMKGTCQPGMIQLTLTAFSLLNLYQVFVIWSVSLLPYNLDSLYRDHTLIMESTYVTWHWPIFTVSWFCYILLIRSVYPLLYNLSPLYFIHTLIMESTSARHVWPDLEPFFHGLLVLTYIYVKYGWLGQFQRICLHFDDGAGSFMVHWFNFFLKKYFTQIICRRQTRHIFIYSCLIIP